MQKKKGFSLIELLIVITIVGILAAIAVPYYKSYTMRTKISNALTVASGFDTKIQQFFSAHGRFPDLETDLKAESLTDVATPIYPPYLLMYVGQGNSNPTPPECSYGYYYGYLINYDGGNIFAGDPGRGAFFYNYFINVNGTIQKYCIYEEVDEANAPTLRQIIPGCTMMINTQLPDELDTLMNSGCSQ